MDTELFELCKEVYERTGWCGTLERFVQNKSGKMASITAFNVDASIHKELTPLYASDYLLEKLKDFGFMDGPSEGINLKTHNNHGWGWLAYIPGYAYRYGGDENVGFADTPLKALLKLTVALDDAGELK